MLNLKIFDVKILLFSSKRYVVIMTSISPLNPILNLIVIHKSVLILIFPPPT